MPGRTKSIQQLRNELKSKVKVLTALKSQRDKIDKQIAALLGGALRGRPKGTAKGTAKAKAAPKRRGRKPAAGGSLVQCIRKVLAKAPNGLRAKDITAAVLKAGYQTSSKDFYGIVAATLRDEKNFKRIKRGVYKVI